MKRFPSRRRFLAGTIGWLALAAASAVLLGPRIVRAFTLAPPNIIYFDAISVPVDHTLHVHIVNQFGTGPMTFRAALKPTTTAVGSTVLSAPVTLSPGDGSDQAFTFAGFSPPAGTTRVPVVCSILAAAATLPSDWSGRVASSVEIVDDVTGKPTAILGGRHIIRAAPGGPLTPCLSCN